MWQIPILPTQVFRRPAPRRDTIQRPGIFDWHATSFRQRPRAPSESRSPAHAQSALRPDRKNPAERDPPSAKIHNPSEPTNHYPRYEPSRPLKAGPSSELAFPLFREDRARSRIFHAPGRNEDGIPRTPVGRSRERKRRAFSGQERAGHLPSLTDYDSSAVHSRQAAQSLNIPLKTGGDGVSGKAGK